MTIREMCKRAQEGSIAKGFAVAGQMPDIDQKLVLAIGELVEAQNEIRNGHTPTDTYFKPNDLVIVDGKINPAPGVKPEGFPIELADAVIRIGQLAEALGIDMQSAIELKMAYNETRPYLHGKRF